MSSSNALNDQIFIVAVQQLEVYLTQQLTERISALNTNLQEQGELAQVGAPLWKQNICELFLHMMIMMIAFFTTAFFTIAIIIISKFSFYFLVCRIFCCCSWLLRRRRLAWWSLKM
jgi:hypothetical protein